MICWVGKIGFMVWFSMFLCCGKLVRNLPHLHFYCGAPQGTLLGLPGLSFGLWAPLKRR